MKLRTVTFLTILVVLTFDVVGSQDVQDSAYCESYNRSTCKEQNEEDCITREKCESAGPDSHKHCFTLWEFNAETGITNVQMKGCFLNNKDCYEKAHCFRKNKDKSKQLHFCCCNGYMCNQNFTFTESLEQPPKVHLNIEIKTFESSVDHVYIMILALCAFTVVTSICFFIWCYRYQKLDYADELAKAELGEVDVQQQSQQSDCQQSDFDETADIITSIELLEKKAEGRFGAVWKARRGDETLAVKVFPLCDRQSWQTELEIFRLPFMDHEDLLRFIGAGRLGDGLDAQFWLVTTYYDNGSLCDYLAENLITWDEMVEIAFSIARGLNHLHHEMFDPAKEGIAELRKPAIAHRDIKSQNVLLSANLRACVADFGLALVFRGKGPKCGDQHGRVGTLRYMAPELLDGAINFNKHSFLAIDVYAYGLVLWELASRCAFKEDLIATEYQLPFAKEVGMQPTLEEMQECVVQQKKRPCIPNAWRSHSGLSTICDTIEECWDDDADARLSISCVLDRISSLRKP